MEKRPVRRAPAVTVAVALIALASASVVLTSVSWQATAYTPRGPIFIEGDADFTPGNGVTGGSGTWDDPYLIEGWEIDASTANGIEVRNTTAHFIVRGVYVHSGGWRYDGLRFLDVQDGRVEGSNATGNWFGIAFWDSANVSAAGNEVHGNDGEGIDAYLSTAVTIRGNTVTGDYGIGVYDSAQATIAGNRVSGTAGVAIGVSNATEVLVDRNTVSGNDFGIEIDYGSANVTVTGNQASGHLDGLTVKQSSTIEVWENRFSGNAFDGIILYQSSNVTVANNTATSNGNSGVRASASSDFLLACNNITGNNWHGVFVGSSTAFTVAYNRVSSNSPFGVNLTGSTAATVHHNRMDNTLQAADDRGPENAWDDGYPSGGNWWVDYAGADFFSGPNQDQPGSDGIGDTPYVIDADSQDGYPLMAPPLGSCPYAPDSPPRSPSLFPAVLGGPASEDVVLSWALSPDDGGGEDDMAQYLLYESAAYDREGVGYTLLATLPAGTTTYTVPGAGVGDPQTHFYRLVARDGAGQATAGVDQFVKYAHHLTAGPHLLSVPVRMSDTSVGTVLRGVDYAVARTYVNPAGQGKNWLTKAKDKPWGDLVTIDETMAVWLLVDTDSDLVVAGLARASTTIRLEVGWNFVGYPSFVDRTVGDALTGAQVQTVEGFDPANPPYYLRRLGPTDPLHAGDGLWVHVNAPFDWNLSS